MSALVVDNVVRRYGDKAAVDGASLMLEKGRITCLLGPSGCGKSTLLRLIAGLEPLDGGRVLASQQVLSGPHVHVPPEQRDVGFVFQDYALFPHLTVAQNVAFGLRKLDAAERTARVEAELAEVHLLHRARSYPQALSGGEQQRVALARALARRPAVVLLDEPFSGLDGRLKASVRDTTLRALRDAGAAALIVTHDAEEALMMADELALMEAGHILQTGSPRECYLNPVSVPAAKLLGEASLLPARIAGGVARTPFGQVPAEGAGSGVVSARPEALRLVVGGAQAEVVAAHFAGSFMLLTLKADGVTAQCRSALGEAPGVGARVEVDLDPRFCATFADS
jgi:iron(III) transport system ATP-binding protein